MNINLKEAIELLNQGEVIGVPTDRVYGLASLKSGVSKLYEIKKRPKSKKIVKMIGSIDQLPVKDEGLKNLMIKEWPGATTIIFEVNGSMESYRIPKEDNILSLLKLLSEDLYVTSANISGEKDIVSRVEFNNQFPLVKLLEEKVECSKTNAPSKILMYNNIDDIKTIR